MRDDLFIPSDWGVSGFIVAIPARNEADRLPVTLSAFASEPDIQDVIVIANGCSDATATIARRSKGLRVAVLETGCLSGGVGEARRMGMQAALDAAPHATILATTDADCVVMPGWGHIVRSAIEKVDVICGRVVPDPEEFARLPRIVRMHGALEDEVAALGAELDGLRAPCTYDPLPRHGQTPGASLAFRTGTYLAAGGFEAIPCHEDRRIVARIEASGGRIARPWDLVVTASCRLEGRAPGGMADTISARATDQIRLQGEIADLRRTAKYLRALISAHHASQLAGAV